MGGIMPDLADTGPPGSDTRLSIPDYRAPYDGGAGYSNFGHPTEVQDVYRELGQGHQAGSQPALPQPLNPPPDFPMLRSVSGKSPARMFEYREYLLAVAPAADIVFLASNVPERWLVTVDATAGARIAVYFTPNSGAGASGWRLGVGGHLLLPGTDRYCVIKNLAATTPNVMICAIAGWDFAEFNYGT